MNQAKQFYGEVRNAARQVPQHGGEYPSLRASVEPIDDSKQKSPNGGLIWAFPMDIWSG